MFYVFGINGPMYHGGPERLSQIAPVRRVQRPQALNTLVADTDTGAPPRAADSTASASARRAAKRGRFACTCTDTLPTRQPASPRSARPMGANTPPVITSGSAATSPATAPLLNTLVQERLLVPIRNWLGGADAEARARVLAGVYIGFLVERLIRGEALEGREREVFVERVTAVFNTLIA